MSGIFGGLTSLILSWMILSKPDIQSVINGILAGLVAVTASVNMVTTPIAILIGIIGSVLCFFATKLLAERKIDDVIGAFPTHGVAGVWGTLAVAILGNPEAWGTGLNRGEQFFAQVVGVAATFVWAFGIGYICIWILKRVISLRITPEEETIGLNISEHGSLEELHDVGLLTH